jgi:hypothetical protein
MGTFEPGLGTERHYSQGEREMAKVIVEFSDEEIMRIEAILMDGDATEALLFMKEVLKPQLRAKGSRALDSGKSTGVMT